jgi:hypothetical protein
VEQELVRGLFVRKLLRWKRVQVLALRRFSEQRLCLEAMGKEVVSLLQLLRRRQVLDQTLILEQEGEGLGQEPMQQEAYLLDKASWQGGSDVVVAFEWSLADVVVFISTCLCLLLWSL